MSETAGNCGREVALANEKHFRALAYSRADVSNIGVVAILVVVLLSLDTFIGLNALIFAQGVRAYLGLFVAHLVVVCLCPAVALLSPFKRLTHRFQTSFSGLMAVLAALLVYSSCLMALTIASFDGVRGQGLIHAVFEVIGVITVASLLVATAVHVLSLRHRLRIGHSEDRTLANFAAKSRSNRTKTFWITFGAVAVVPTVATQGEYVVATIGVLMLIVFVCVMTSLPVEFAYLAYLKSKNRVYWGELPRLTEKQLKRRKAERVRAAKKAVRWLLIGVGSIAVIWVLDLVLPAWFG